MHVNVRGAITARMTAIPMMMMPITHERAHDETRASTNRGASPGIVAQITAIVTDHRTGHAAQHSAFDRFAWYSPREDRSDQAKRQDDCQSFLPR